MASQSGIPTSRDLEQATHMDQLSVFREAVGITDVPSLGPEPLIRSAPNIGIYRRVTSAEKNARNQYYASAALINLCLLLQIVFAAVLTSLGAAGGSYTAITGIGATNTVIAGLLSFTRGKGLPNRLKQFQSNMRKVREYIDQRERDFAQLDCKLDVQDEIKAVVDLYENARNNDEANDPDAYHQPSIPSATTKHTTVEVHEKPALQISSSSTPNIVPDKLRERNEEPETVVAESSRSAAALQKAPEGHADRHGDRDILTEVAKRMLSGRHNW